MFKVIIACFAAFVAISAFSAGFGLKPGLWETRIVNEVLDGRDTASEAARMNQSTANMSPEQRARMEAMINKQHGGPTMGGSGRICITREMASRDEPLLDPEGRCQPAPVRRNGNHTSFTFSCNLNNGAKTTGKSDSTSSGALITTQYDMTTTEANGETHVKHTETEMKFVASDCGDVKPIAAPNASP
jgi:hypothetical protein